MKTAIVIPSLYEVDKDYLKVCVESLRDSGFDGQVIVVTNGSHKPHALTEKIPGITVHLHTEQQGQCNAVNIGAQVVSPDTEYLMVSNSDMYYAPGWDKNLRYDDLCFSPNLVEPINNNGSADPFLKLDAGYTLEEFNQAKVDEFVKKEMEVKEETGGVGEDENGFNLPFFIRKDVWQTIGGYDIEYDPWGSNSDTDLQTKIMLAGIMPKRYRDVLVYHFSNKSGTFDGSHQTEWQHNFDYYTQKWGFNRDMLPTDVWYCKDVLPEDDSMIKYRPVWKGKYAVGDTK